MGALTAPFPVNGTLVIGGGPAGSAAAIVLARAGHDVTLAERERAATAKVCGEFLSVEACAEARALGVDPVALGAAPIDRVRVTWGSTTVESRLPFRAASLSRRTFDEAMLAAAEAAGAQVLRGTRVVALDGLRATLRPDGDGDARICEARAIVLASGKADLPGFRRSGGHFPDALGFKMHLALDARERDELGTAVELTLFPGGYAGMQRIENDLVAFALVVRRDVYAKLGSWIALKAAIANASERAAHRLAHARDVWPKALAVSGVPYGFMYRDAAAPGDGLYRAGDQLAVIPSFTGDGMAIALVTGACAGRAIVRGDDARTFHGAMRARLRKPMAVAGALSRAIATPAGRAAVVWPARAIPAIFTFAAAQTRIPRDESER